ncbi:MAG TPA: hypothetical protein VJ905_07225 [Halalkalibaculum sp.]|nr:hypothetical protein [Halalkalibaculum sp.]
MIKLYTSTIMILILTLGIACNKETKETQDVVQETEISGFLTEHSFGSSTGLENAEMNIKFWKKKLASSPESMTYHSKLAGAYASRFSIIKDINDLQKADSLYTVAFNLAGGKNVDNLQAMGHLAITRHKFTEAQQWGLKALEVGDKKTASHKLLFDALMERGDYELAKKHLSKLENKNSFAYLIRLSKYKDHEGNLDSALHYMERAKKRIGYNHTLRAWSESNLGDMYGHANHIQKSYDSYMQVLHDEQTGASWLHSLEGIAWIAYAHDDNADLARQILTYVDDRIQSPGVKLKLAEIAEYQNKPLKKEQYLQAFLEEAGKPVYQGMYDAKLIEIAATEMSNYDRAKKLVAEELRNRPNPSTYNLKALNYLEMGKAEKALEIIESKVKDRTYEPVPVLNMARVYKANGMFEKAQEYFEQALLAGYELGPVTVNNIKNELEQM